MCRQSDEWERETVVSNKKTVFKILTVLILLSLVFGTYLLTFYIKNNYDRKFFYQIKENEKLKHAPVFVKEFTDFEWDKVCLYEYGADASREIIASSSKDSICEDCLDRLEFAKNQSDITLLVFFQKNEVINVFYHPTEIILSNNIQNRQSYNCGNNSSTFSYIPSSDSYLIKLTQ